MKINLSLRGSNAVRVVKRSDFARDKWMVENGYRVVRFTNADVLGNVEGVATCICEEIGRFAPSRLRERD